MLRTFIPLLAAASLVACNSAEPVTNLIEISTEEKAAEANFTPTAALTGGKEVVILTGATHGALCNSRLQPVLGRDGSVVRVTLTRVFVPPAGTCVDTDRKIEYVVRVLFLRPGNYTMEYRLVDEVRNETSTQTLGPVTVIPCDATCGTLGN